MYIVYGALLFVSFGIFVATSIAKAKIGWSWCIVED